MDQDVVVENVNTEGNSADPLTKSLSAEGAAYVMGKLSVCRAENRPNLTPGVALMTDYDSGITWQNVSCAFAKAIWRDA